MSDEPPGFAVVFLRAGRVLVVFAAVAAVGLVAVAPALVPVYLGFRFGQSPQFGQYRELLALVGIVLGGVVAFVYTRPVFAYGTKYVGRWS